MTVSPQDVRAALNEMSEEELADSTIDLKLKDARFRAKKLGLGEGTPEWERFVRAKAALGSFIISNTYQRTDFGDIAVTREWERIVDELENEMEEALEEAGIYDYYVTSTPMFDSRPKDKDRESELVSR